MKATLIILALLVHTVHSDSNTRAETLQLFNSARSMIAKNAQIANMYQLAYDPELEKALYGVLGKKGGCPDPKTLSGSFDSEIHLEFHLNVRPEKLKDEKEVLKLVGGVGKTHMGYVETICMVNGEEVHSYVFYKTNDEEVHGPPGSQCPQGRRTTSDGLCGPSLKRKNNPGTFEEVGKNAGKLLDKGIGMWKLGK
ncbi:unnamed protein product [Caenorhabditis nigoni]